MADHLILPLVGPEVIAGSTRMKAGTATKLVLNTITTGAMIRSGRVFENLMVDLRARSAKLVDRGLRIFVTLTGASREEARRALIRTGGAVKTALAMHALRVDRALAERYLDCADGFLGLAVERFGGRERPCYGGYPTAPGWPDGAALLARLSAAPARLGAARAAGAAAEAEGQRIAARRTAWTPGQHAAHLADFERSAVRPRVERWLEAADSSGSLPTFEDWTADAPPPERGFETETAGFSAERARTVAAVADDPEPVATVLSRRARVGSETLTLYQFLRGVAQHDAAHETRLRERVHPALLTEGGA